jgi:hypothetical protein
MRPDDRAASASAGAPSVRAAARDNTATPLAAPFTTARRWVRLRSSCEALKRVGARRWTRGSRWSGAWRGSSSRRRREWDRS